MKRSGIAKKPQNGTVKARTGSQTGQDKAKKGKPRKPVSVTASKKKAWKAFADYIKTRDALKTTGTLTHCVCVTCGGTFPVAYQKQGAYIQAGHAIDGRGKNILFDEDLVNGQCSACNCVFNGRLPEYAGIMIKKHGQEWWDEKCRFARKPAAQSWKAFMLMEIESEYAARLADLKGKA